VTGPSPSSCSSRRRQIATRNPETKLLTKYECGVRFAQKLVQELMEKRGYPMGDFERCASDISVDHPVVVENYRAAQVIVTRHEKDTEQLRRALVHYRALFDELLEVERADAVTS
jgi:hypothetical protein